MSVPPTGTSICTAMSPTSVSLDPQGPCMYLLYKGMNPKCVWMFWCTKNTPMNLKAMCLVIVYRSQIWLFSDLLHFEFYFACFLNSIFCLLLAITALASLGGTYPYYKHVAGLESKVCKDRAVLPLKCSNFSADRHIFLNISRDF